MLQNSDPDQSDSDNLRIELDYTLRLSCYKFMEYTPSPFSVRQSFSMQLRICIVATSNQARPLSHRRGWWQRGRVWLPSSTMQGNDWMRGSDGVGNGELIFWGFSGIQEFEKRRCNNSSVIDFSMTLSGSVCTMQRATHQTPTLGPHCKHQHCYLLTLGPGILSNWLFWSESNRLSEFYEKMTIPPLIFRHDQTPAVDILTVTNGPSTVMCPATRTVKTNDSTKCRELAAGEHRQQYGQPGRAGGRGAKAVPWDRPSWHHC